VIGVAPAAAAVSWPGVRVAFVGVDGDERRGPLDRLWNVRFEQAVPVRAFGSFQGQCSFQGSWWFATTGEHVGFESWVERDVVMMLDFDPDVVAVSSQPFWLSWNDGNRHRRHVPDYFARLSNGSAVVIDVRQDERIGADDAEVFAATERACDAVGWRYRRVGVVDDVLAANVRWLSGYRHRRCLHDGHAARLRDLLTTPMPLAGAVDVVGDWVSVSPTLFHLLWSGVVRADLRAAPLTPATVVSCGASRS
jgi:hypothetical protein